MRISQELADAEQLIEILRQRFSQTKVIRPRALVWKPLGGRTRLSPARPRACSGYDPNGVLPSPSPYNGPDVL